MSMVSQQKRQQHGYKHLGIILLVSFIRRIEGAPKPRDVCEFVGEGGTVFTFQRGESIHSYQPSSCQDSETFQCICNPDIHDQMECPFCWMTTTTNDSDGILCVEDGNSITYTTTDGLLETCSCRLSSRGDDIFSTHCRPATTMTSTSTTRSDPMAETGTLSNEDGFDLLPRNDDEEDEDESEGLTDPEENESFGLCDFNGNLFFPGENVGTNFVTRCGDVTEFPCFCNPEKNPPVDCPYCGFVLTKENLLCLKNEQTASFVDIYGDDKICECKAPTISSVPVENCVLTSTDINACVFRDGNGYPFTFDVGAPVDTKFLPLGNCGPEFQCFCDPQADDQLSCPFCVEVDFGGELICASEGESVEYQDENGIDRTCFCDVPSDQKPFINCDDEPPPIRPTLPTPMPIGPPSMRPPTPNEPTPFPIDSPSIDTLPSRPTADDDDGDATAGFSLRPTTNSSDEDDDEEDEDDATNGSGDDETGEEETDDDDTDDEETGDNENDDEETDNSNDIGDGSVCVVRSIDGEEITVDDGEPFGPELGDGECGRSSEWPKICNAAGRTEAEQITYPYCIFENTALGTVQCAKDNESVRFLDSSRNEVFDSSRKEVECFCTLGQQPETSCEASEPAPDPSSNRDSTVTFSMVLILCVLFEFL